LASVAETVEHHPYFRSFFVQEPTLTVLYSPVNMFVQAHPT